MEKEPVIMKDGRYVVNLEYIRQRHEELLNKSSEGTEEDKRLCKRYEEETLHKVEQIADILNLQRKVFNLESRIVDLENILLPFLNKPS